MTKSVGVHEAKTHLSRLLEQVRAGDEIVIVGVPIMTADRAFSKYDVEVVTVGR